jgi:urease accessory protein
VFEGFFSGMAHPVIGLDHLAFIIAAGLVGGLIKRGIIIPITFVVVSLGGTKEMLKTHYWLMSLYFCSRS